LKIRVIVNRGGGTADAAKAEQLRTLFEDQSVEADIRLIDGGDAEAEFAEAAAAEGLDAVVAGGGDGTINAAAAALTGGTTPLGLLPMGTLNHFARDAGIPKDLEGAVAVIAGGRSRPVDVAEVNGRIFVNNSAVGLYPEFVRGRDAQRRRFGRSKRLAMLVASVRALRHFSRHRLTIRIAGREEAIETPLLFVGNNHYDTALLTLGQRARLDGGELCLYAVLARTPLHFLGLAMRGLVGQLDQQDDFISLDGIEEAEIVARDPHLAVSTDGETCQLESPLQYKIRPGALRLIVPQEAES